MKSVFATVAAAALLATSAVAQLTVFTPPSAVVCQPLLITWQGGVAPYFLVRNDFYFVIYLGHNAYIRFMLFLGDLEVCNQISTLLPAVLIIVIASILPGGQPTAPALVDFGQQNGTSLRWIVNQPVGTQLGLNLRDQTGTLVQSSAFPVQAGSDTSCVGVNPSSSSTTSASNTGTNTGTTRTGTSITTTSTTSTTAITTITTPITTATQPTTTSTRPTTTAPATTTSSGAAVHIVAKTGLVGAFGAALAVLLA
ncbi:hypothetical protein B0H34DRAFT_802052 [Crassisporium funariophilum]|nr:hypothetical protein B0H34DRAFT_802052 [Crassisporium funariophilum]